MSGRQNNLVSVSESGKAQWPFQLSLIGAALGFAVPAGHAWAAPGQDDAGASASSTDTYNFDSSLLLGTPLGVADIERFNKASTIEPGSYRVDVYVNNVFITRKTVDFRSTASGDVQPCLSDALLGASGILLQPADADLGADAGAPDGAAADADVSDASTEHRTADAAHGRRDAAEANGARCVALSERVPGASAKFDLSRLRLDVSVPQTQMRHVPRGTIDPASLDAGRTMAYFNYDTNYYTASSLGSQSNSVYAGINAGLNIGLWRFHQQSAYTFNGTVSGNASRWDNIRTYVERPLVSIGSKLVVGDNFTGGSLLSPVGYRGIHLESDDRMLPDSLRGYAPTVKGVANTNARVVVSQNGNVIYQATVAPGPFAFSDLNPTSYQGDLTVQVFEANGHVSTFKVPFSAVSNSLRPGASRYSFTLGQVRQIEGSHAAFADLTYERGLTNMLTVNGGARVSVDYQSLLGGVVFATSYGAFGLNAAWSNALDERGKRVHGWLGSINYSHTIQPTLTTIALTGYHYSTRGYRDFASALTSRNAYRDASGWLPSTYQQRDQLTLNVNQSLGRLGSLSLSASTSSYYGSRSRDTQYQFSYSNNYRSISYNLSVVRQRTGSINGVGRSGVGRASLTNWASEASTAVMATISIPLGSSPRAPTFSGSVASATDQGASYQASVNGTVGESQSLSYGLTVSGDTSAAPSYGGNVQKNLSMITVGANYSQGKGYWQAGANARGALVAHGGGVTLGPYLGDTFGIVEAKGAEGATVRNTQGTKIDRFGYAIIPSLTPYRYNDVALDAKGINRNAELTANEIRVAPYAGSAVLLKFATRTGHALLIHATDADGDALPLGADVRDGTGATIGVVGQGGQVYARVPDQQGSLTVKWGDRREEQCAIDYRLNGQDSKALITRFDARCTPIETTALAH
ncbi:fimbria/pilus outer membrane usher protein [Burkholderia guangdongensis]|uniref:fimbria/pilus outer membrane usher protein n=1 Tax=Burkholderia guangdongensis TaxID=1792500 RepID=UPI0015C9D581|nr:fimbria/pilus outer membrane usher protein [Burkholderia guangdongensis]